MDISALKTFIFENQKVEDILQLINCHSIKYHHAKNYWTCGNQDGNNKTAITVYNNENLNVINYTRDMTNGKNTPTDLLTLVCYNKQLSFFEGLKFIANILDIDYYYDFNAEVPESLRITKLIYSMQQGDSDADDDKPLKPIPEKILSYYKPYLNDMFLQDNISYETQVEFSIGYDPESNRITIPLFSELGDLVGIHGRLFKQELTEDEQKYIYLEPCSKSKILYGLHKTYLYIQKQRLCYILESPKAVMQLWNMGVYNSVATLGTKISSQQIEKLIRLGVDLCFCFDKDVTKKEIESIADRFVDGVPIYYLLDDKGILNNKESPSDNVEKWQKLNKECFYRIK